MSMEQLKLMRKREKFFERVGSPACKRMMEQSLLDAVELVVEAPWRGAMGRERADQKVSPCFENFLFAQT